jgi:hypothetical protein
MLFGDVLMLMNLVYGEYQSDPLPEYTDVHLLAESVARMFPGRLVAQHGFVYHLAARKETNRFELPESVRKLGWEVEVRFNTRYKIRPKLGHLKAVPYSWLLHERSDTVIDLIPLGGEPGVDYPVRHAPHPDRPPYNCDPKFELLRGKLPTPEKVQEVWKKFENWAKDPERGNISQAVY